MHSISASYQHDAVGLSVASVDLVLDLWYVSRVMVREKYRGTGIGTKMLKSLIVEIKSRPDKGNIIVFPGGYDGDTEKQNAFYKKNGFIDGDVSGKLIYLIE